MNTREEDYVWELGLSLSDTFGVLSEAILRLPEYSPEELNCSERAFQQLQQTALREWQDYEPEESDFYPTTYRPEMFDTGHSHLLGW